MRAIGVATIAAIPMSGCASVPSISVLCAYFPDGLFCIVAGVALAVVIHVMLKRLQADDLIGLTAVVYPALVTFLALAVWLMLFQDWISFRRMNGDDSQQDIEEKTADRHTGRGDAAVAVLRHQTAGPRAVNDDA